MKEGAQVRGINTAATLWASAAVGAFAGSAQYGEAALVAAFVLAGNTLLRPLANYINRRPITAEATEAVYRVHVTCRPENVADARDLLSEELEQRSYPIRDVETLSEGEELIELAATLVPTTANPDDLDAVTRHLERHDAIESATWTVSTESVRRKRKSKVIWRATHGARVRIRVQRNSFYERTAPIRRPTP